MRTPLRGLFRPAQTERPAWWPLAFFAAYVTIAAAAYAMTLGAGGLAVLWINNGLLAAALLLLPRSSAIPLAVVCAQVDFLAALLTGSAPSQAALIAIFDLTESVAAAFLIRQVGGAGLDIQHFSRLWRVALLAVLPTTLVMGSLGAALLTRLIGGDFVSIWIAWAGGDFLGMMIGAPAVLLLTRMRRYATPEILKGAVPMHLVAAALMVAAMLFHFLPAAPLFLSFPLLLAVLLRLDPPRAVLAIAGFAFLTAGSTTMGHGPIAAQYADISSRILALQTYLAAIQFCALAIISVMSERTRAQTGLSRALSAARAARREAEAAAVAKSRFLAVMSHEMRTPLNGISGHVQLLGAKRALPRSTREPLAAIQASCGVLVSLIDDVLDYSSVGEGQRQRQLNLAPVSIPALVERVVALMPPLLGDRPIALRVEISAPAEPLHSADENRLAQILFKLLSNAAKFTQRGQITLSVAIKSSLVEGVDDVTFCLADTGMGIAPDELPLLFRPFSQIDSTPTRKFSGAGLGLAISRALVEMMGGSLTVESTLGLGSRFTFSLPMRRVDRLEPTQAAPAPPLDLRLLVVDDHPMNRQIASQMLEAAGFKVDTAENGEDAVQRAGQASYHAIFMDLHMPVMDGLEACRLIKALGGAAGRTPIIAMTAATSKDDIAACLAAGMVDHIAKPIQLMTLIAAATKAVPNKAA